MHASCDDVQLCLNHCLLANSTKLSFSFACSTQSILFYMHVNKFIHLSAIGTSCRMADTTHSKEVRLNACIRLITFQFYHASTISSFLIITWDLQWALRAYLQAKSPKLSVIKYQFVSSLIVARPISQQNQHSCPRMNTSSPAPPRGALRNISNNV